jgi:type II secretory pathway component PulM
MKLDPLQRLVVNRQILTPRPRNRRMVAGLALLTILAVALLMIR